MQKRWKILSIPVSRCERLPSLWKPKGYVCILRDSKTGNYMIANVDLPKFFMKSWSKSPKRYALLRILRADNAVGLKKHLHQRYKKSWIRNHHGWFRLDDAQLRDLDQFIEQCTRHFDVDSQQLERWNLKYFAGSFYKHLPRQQLPSGYIYVLKDHYTEDYKIGYTSHLVKRIMYLEEKASGDVEYVHILQSERVKETEAFLHKRFQSRRTRPSKDWEWFRLDESHLQEIQNLAERRPRSRQVAANGQSSETAALPPQLSQSAQSAFSEPATEVSPDTRPSKAQIVDSQQSPRARRLLAYFLAAVLILAAAILAYAHFAADAFGLG